MWFSVVCTLMKQYAASQWSKCWGLTRRTTVMTHNVWYRNTYHAKPHSICFSPQCQRQRKGFFFFSFFFFWPRSWHKERSSVEYNFPNQISLLPQISVSDWLLQQETAATRILHRAKRPQSWTFTHKNTTSFVPLLQISRRKYNRFAVKHTHWHLQWCSLGRSHLERYAWHIDSRSVGWTLIYDGKLANQNARLVAIVTIYVCWSHQVQTRKN